MNHEPLEMVSEAVHEMEAAGATIQYKKVYDTLFEVTVAWDGYELAHRAVRGYPVAEAYLEFAAIQQMRADGMTVTLDRMTDHRFRVRVRSTSRHWDTNAAGKQMSGWEYNVHTTSTSGYPILTAFEKYQAWKRGEA